MHQARNRKIKAVKMEKPPRTKILYFHVSKAEPEKCRTLTLCTDLCLLKPEFCNRAVTWTESLRRERPWQRRRAPLRQAAAPSRRPPGRQGAPSASSAVSQRLTLGVRMLRAHRGHLRRRLPTCAVSPGLQDVEMGARVSRAFRNFNLENRTEREISKMKPSTAPKHPSTRVLLQEQLSRECGPSLPPPPPPQASGDIEGSAGSGWVPGARGSARSQLGSAQGARLA